MSKKKRDINFRGNSDASVEIVYNNVPNWNLDRVSEDMYEISAVLEECKKTFNEILCEARLYTDDKMRTECKSHIDHIDDALDHYWKKIGEYHQFVAWMHANPKVYSKPLMIDGKIFDKNVMPNNPYATLTSIKEEKVASLSTENVN